MEIFAYMVFVISRSIAKVFHEYFLHTGASYHGIVKYKALGKFSHENFIGLNL